MVIATGPGISERKQYTPAVFTGNRKVRLAEKPLKVDMPLDELATLLMQKPFKSKRNNLILSEITVQFTLPFSQVS